MNTDNAPLPSDDHTTEEADVGEATIDHAVAEVFERHGRDMVRRAKSVLRSDADAQDVVQDVMLGIIRAPHVLGVVERLGAWLVSLVHRRCVDVIRGDVRRGEREAGAVGGIEALFPGRDPAEIAEHDEVCGEVARAVDRLDGDLRAVFVANVLEEKTYREISEETGIPMGTLMARKAKALSVLRDDLARRGMLQRDLSKGDM